MPSPEAQPDDFYRNFHGPMQSSQRSASSPTTLASAGGINAHGSKKPANASRSIAQLISQYDKPSPPTVTTPPPRSRYIRQRTTPPNSSTPPSQSESTPVSPGSASHVGSLSSRASTTLDPLKENEFGPARYRNRSQYAVGKPSTTPSSRRASDHGKSASRKPHGKTNGSLAPRTSDSHSAPYRPPLFGEVLQYENATSDAGHGIAAAHYRRSSEGNLQRPEFSFAHSRSRSYQEADHLVSPLSNNASQDERAPSAQGHRRSRSDIPTTPVDASSMNHAHALGPPPDQGSVPAYVPGGALDDRHRSQRSRIPVPAMRPSMSDSGSSGPSRNGSVDDGGGTTRPSSRLTKASPWTSGRESRTRPTTPASARSGIPVRTFEAGTIQHTSTNQKVNAYIAATQLPKGSPPLRSSRPRQPVSATSNSTPKARASDRAFTPTARDTMEAKLSPRQRPKPKELAGMDFSARRAMISKSVKEKDEARLEQIRQRVATVRNMNTRKPSEDHPAVSQQKEGAPEYKEGGAITTATLRDIEEIPAVPSIPETYSPISEIAPPSPHRVPGAFPSNQRDDGPDSKRIASKTSGGTLRSREYSLTETPRIEIPVHSDRDMDTVYDHIMNMRSHSSTPNTEFADTDTPADKRDQESIHIMLGHSPMSEPDSFEQSPSERGSTIRPEDSISMALGGQTSLLAANEWTPNLDVSLTDDTGWSPHTETYSTINRVLDHYHNGADLSPAVTSELKQQVEAVSPEAASYDQWNSREATEAYLKELMEDRFRTPDASLAQERPDSMSGMSDAIRSTYHDDGSDVGGEYAGTAIIYGQPSRYSYTSHGESEVSSAQDTGPTPPPKEWTEHSDASFSRDPSPPNVPDPSRVSATSFSAQGGPQLPEIEGTGGGLGLSIHVPATHSAASSRPPPPTKPPPPPPLPSAAAKDPRGLTLGSAGFSPSLYSVNPPSSIFPFAVPPAGPHRQYSYDVTNTNISESSTAPPSAAVSSASLPATSGATESVTEIDRDEQKRLIRRKHLIKELLDTESSFHQDMKIVEDIYKATTSSVDAIKDNDRKTLFGNSEQIVDFSAKFTESLMFAAASVYVLPKSSRFTLPRGSFSTGYSNATDRSSLRGTDNPQKEQDNKTYIGKAFMSNLKRMERVYEIYLKNHDAANQRLKALQEKPKVRIWLQECHTYASDLTQAWDLDSLLVKPTQRVLKYPLILDSLVKETPEDHPDYKDLKDASEELKHTSARINESKKRQELMDQMDNRKRKESESLMPSGLARAFGRRTEKLKQQVGIVEAIDDKDYDALSQRFGGHFFSLQIVMRDVEKYMGETRAFIERLIQLTSTMESFLVLQIDADKVEKGDTDPVLESKWRKLALIVREINQVALPDHIAQVQRSVMEPIIKLWHLHHKPQKMMQTRKDHLAEYVRYRNIVERGDKLDKKTRAQGEQWTALNETLKEELPKLYSTTKTFIETIMMKFVTCQLDWQKTLELKFKTAVEARRKSKDYNADLARIVEDFQSDYQIIDDQVLQLGICNGSTASDAMTFLSPASTFGLDGTSSPKRPATLASKRTESMNSETFEAAALPGFHARYGDQLNFPPFPYEPGSFHQDLRAHDSPANRTRANSTLSSRGAQTPLSLSASYGPSTHPIRPSTSAGRSAEPSPSLPRPDLLPRQSYTSNRDGISSTGSSRFSGLFSSAMPMSDSPGATRPPTPDRSKTPPKVLFLAASLFEFNIANDRREAGYPYLRYVQGEVFDVLGQKGELWLARNQDDPNGQIGWIWEKHFAPISDSS